MNKNLGLQGMIRTSDNTADMHLLYMCNAFYNQQVISLILNYYIKQAIQIYGVTRKTKIFKGF